MKLKSYKTKMEQNNSPEFSCISCPQNYHEHCANWLEIATDVQDLFARSPWAKSLDRNVLRFGEQMQQAVFRIEALEGLGQKVADQHEDTFFMEALWSYRIS